MEAPPHPMRLGPTERDYYLLGAPDATRKAEPGGTDTSDTSAASATPSAAATPGGTETPATPDETGYEQTGAER
jgi:hypothetical protein